jgi:hypothetical protein
MLNWTVGELLFLSWMILGLPLRLLAAPVILLICLALMYHEMGGLLYFKDAVGMTLFTIAVGFPPWSS